MSETSGCRRDPMAKVHDGASVADWKSIDRHDGLYPTECLIALDKG